jgi:hypothetical protein
VHNSLIGFSRSNRIQNLHVLVQIQFLLNPGVLAEKGKHQIHKRTNQTYEGQRHMHLLSEFPCKNKENLPHVTLLLKKYCKESL